MRRVFLALAVFSLLAVALSRADEGMWTFDNPPAALLKRDYGFEPTQEWLDHVRLASVRFNDGGSGSFISPEGLVLTNHHVGLGSIQKLSTKDKDYVKLGFYAKTRAEEPRCPDLELNVLMSMEDVTARVQGAVQSGASDKDANKHQVVPRTMESSTSITFLPRNSSSMALSFWRTDFFRAA